MSLNDFLHSLRTSKIVNRIVSTKFDAVSDSYILKVRAELINGWLMDCWEHKTPIMRRYSFHIFHKGRMIVRWDNTPHYRELDGFPHHKHEGKDVVDSEEMTLVTVLEELERIVKSHE